MPCHWLRSGRRSFRALSCGHRHSMIWLQSGHRAFTWSPARLGAACAPATAASRPSDGCPATSSVAGATAIDAASYRRNAFSVRGQASASETGCNLATPPATGCTLAIIAGRCTACRPLNLPSGSGSAQVFTRSGRLRWLPHAPVTRNHEATMATPGRRGTRGFRQVIEPTDALTPTHGAGNRFRTCASARPRYR